MEFVFFSGGETPPLRDQFWCCENFCRRATGKKRLSPRESSREAGERVASRVQDFRFFREGRPLPYKINFCAAKDFCRISCNGGITGGSLREGAGSRCETEGACAILEFAQILFCTRAPSTTSWSPFLPEEGLFKRQLTSWRIQGLGGHLRFC